MREELFLAAVSQAGELQVSKALGLSTTRLRREHEPLMGPELGHASAYVLGVADLDAVVDSHLIDLGLGFAFVQLAL